MSVIEVKAFRPKTTPTDPAEAYVLKSTDKQARTKTPYILGVVLMGIAAYLKSIFPSASRPEDAPWTPKPQDSQGLAGEGIDGAEASLTNAPLPAVEPQDDGDTGAIGSGGKLVRLQEPMDFMLVEAPEFDFSAFATTGIAAFKPVPPPLRAGLSLPANNLTLPANDNDAGSGGGAVLPPRPLPTNPDGPASPDGPDQPDGPDMNGPTGPDNPGDPNSPGNPIGPADPADPTGPGMSDPCEDEDDEDESTQPNRAPRVSGSVCLLDISGCTMLVIALTDLLRHATDPDGDVLMVKDITVSSGTIIASGDGWLYQPEPQLHGPVTITYRISDGEFSVAQSAHFSVVRTARIEGSDCDDTITGTACADEINGGDGNDSIDAREGDDVVYGSKGDDIIHGGDGNDTLCGGDGNDIIFAGAGDDIVHGGSGKDLLSGGDGNDLIFGDEDDDMLFGDEGDDILHGGEGSDMLAGGIGHDQLFGDEGNDRLFGEDGDDLLAGGTGADFLDGGDGNDTLDGGDGDDVLTDGAGSDNLHGGAGNDIVLAAADGEDDQFDGGAGTDTLDYSADDDGISIDLDAGIATGTAIGHDTLESFETVIGGTGDDTIQGSAADETLYGGDGDDVLADGAGLDNLHGGAGNDTVLAAADGDDDQFDGGEGTDTLDYSADDDGISVDLDAGTATGTAIGHDSLESFETVIGGAGDDTIQGSAADETLYGGDGDDVLADGAGSDNLHGGTGDDTVLAAADGDDDQFDGGEGCDTLDYSTTSEGILIDAVAGQASGDEIGTDTIAGFENYVGGAGDDHFVVGACPTILTGGEGNDIFEFTAPATPDLAEAQTPTPPPVNVVHAIVDFRPGDLACMSKWDIFEKTMDRLEDHFEKIYGDDIDADDVPIRFRHEQYDDVKKTVIEADLNFDDYYETTILLEGHRALVITEHC